jgi:indolepyruvate ferredoxin oxidoreductase
MGVVRRPAAPATAGDDRGSSRSASSASIASADDRKIKSRVAFINASEPALANRNYAAACRTLLGCPHNTSTKVPEAAAPQPASAATSWPSDGPLTSAFTHGRRGRRGSASAVHRRKHIFANLGDGTYYHSGSPRFSRGAANINITDKILYNDAVAMIGGQPMDGPLTPADIARQVMAEGVKTVVVVSDEPDKYPSGTFAPNIEVHHRDDLDKVQRTLRDTQGVTVLLYDQTCAAEKRRRRKRGKFPDPAKRVVINELVCEGCGDCGVKSNCVSVAPVETEFGRKRTIDQSSCNKDYSCVNSFCPSFVTVEVVLRRRRQLRASFRRFLIRHRPARPSPTAF